mgnify:CR=1 FL=1
MSCCLKIDAADNVATALRDLNKGTVATIGEDRIRLLNDILQGHKFAVANIEPGTDVIKYGASIGRASQAIAVGEHVHTHNLKTKLDSSFNYKYQPQPVASLLKPDVLTFMGYLRADGQVGIRNEIWVLPTVGCTNRVAGIIAEQARNALQSEPWAENIDGIYAFPHQFGCSQLGDDHLNTQKLLVSLAKHPNAAGVLFVGLGCENNQISGLQSALGDYDPNRIKFLVNQEVEDEITVGTGLVVELAKQASSCFRQPLPLKALKLGLKCGGSDGLSGITANPLVGWISDIVIDSGGISALTEVPEMFGAETLLMKRATNEDVFNKTVELINDFKDYFIKNEQPVYENPSPGNKAGGITSLEDKSLGCTQKAGTSPVVDVLKYGDRLKSPGLNLLSAPGNDLVASSALAAAGCQVVLFTTGRGTPFGSFVPTMKISTNTDLATRKPNWIDFNAGVLVEDQDMDTVVKEFTDYIIKVASGELVNNEKMNFRELAIFKSGITL